MKKIAKLLKADINATSDLAEIAAMLQNKGRGKDTILAHITPDEAELLKQLGGRGSTNPETGLLEFENEIYDFTPTPAPTEQFGDFQPGGQTPEQVAAANQDLYPGGQAYKEGRTLFTPQGQSYNILPGRTQEDIDRFAASLPGSAPLANQSRGLTTQPPTPAAVAPRVDLSKEFGTGEYGPTPPEKTDFLKGLTKGLTSQDMVRLGLAGALAPVGLLQARKGAKQAEAAAAEQKAIGAPYQAKGQELLRAAEAGELTPTSQQSLQALQARLAQGVESRGGVGAAQVAAQTEAYRQQLLSQQYNLGLQVSNIGDQIALGAIRTGLAADQALSQASTNFYTNLAAIGAGIPIARSSNA